MSTIVITGQPCSGKSTYISNELKTHSDTRYKNPSYHNKIYHFFSGIKYLGISRAKQLTRITILLYLFETYFVSLMA